MNTQKVMLSSLSIFLVGLMVLVTIQGAAADEATIECATSQCHPGLQKKEPALPKGHGDCTGCHQAADQAKNHPETGAKSFTVAKDICQGCHQIIVDYNNLHPPVAAGDCLVCHTFHSSNSSLLTESPDHILCYNCHSSVTKEGDTNFHASIDQGKCSTCHNVHGSFFKHLLAGPYSTDFFNDYDEKQYAFCFQCHKIDLLLHENTSYNTNFRDGQKNLHFVHVNRKSRGRACKSCHVTHSGHLPKLMAEQVSFGDWEMPVNFVINPNGGQCTPGCHAPAAYDRTRPTPPSLQAKPPSVDELEPETRKKIPSMFKGPGAKKGPSVQQKK